MKECYDGGACRNEELVEELTEQRDALLAACKALRLCIDDRQYPDVYHQACEAIAAVEEDTANTTDATKDIQARRDTAALPMVDADGWDPAGDADGHS